MGMMQWEDQVMVRGRKVVGHDIIGEVQTGQERESDQTGKVMDRGGKVVRHDVMEGTQTRQMMDRGGKVVRHGVSGKTSYGEERESGRTW